MDVRIAAGMNVAERAVDELRNLQPGDELIVDAYGAHDRTEKEKSEPKKFAKFDVGAINNPADVSSPATTAPKRAR